MTEWCPESAEGLSIEDKFIRNVVAVGKGRRNTDQRTDGVIDIPPAFGAGGIAGDRIQIGPLGENLSGERIIVFPLLHIADGDGVAQLCPVEPGRGSP